MKKLSKEEVSYWLFVYPLMLAIGFFFAMLKLFGRIKVRGELSSINGGFIIASNHPSLWEPMMLLAVLLDKRFLLESKSRSPMIVPDKNNYSDHLLWSIFGFMFVPVPRDEHRGKLLAFKGMEAILKDGRILVLFPEGGRTYKGEKFHYSARGKRIRELKPGIGRLVHLTLAPVIPVWVEGTQEVLPSGSNLPKFWKKVFVRVGKPLYPLLEYGKSKREIITQNTDQIANALLALADEE